MIYYQWKWWPFETKCILKPRCVFGKPVSEVRVTPYDSMEVKYPFVFRAASLTARKVTNDKRKRRAIFCEIINWYQIGAWCGSWSHVDIPVKKIRSGQVKTMNPYLFDKKTGKIRTDI